MNKDIKKDEIDILLEKIRQKRDDLSIMRIGEGVVRKVESLSTGIIKLDSALGIGGLPFGRIVQIFGPESSGKTTIALHVIAEAQKKGLHAAFIDLECALDLNYASRIGVDIKKLIISQPNSGEEALDIVYELIKSGKIGAIVVDSVAALVPKAELEGSMGDSGIGLQARLVGKALRMFTSILSKYNTLMLFINQIRDKINQMGYGPSETVSGGRALKFFSSVSLDVRKITAIKQGSNDNQEIIGNMVEVKVVKNKLGAPFKKARFEIIYGEGVSNEGELIDLAIQNDVIRRSGSWFNFGETKLGQGRESVRKLLQENKDVYNKIYNCVTNI